MSPVVIVSACPDSKTVFTSVISTPTDSGVPITPSILAVVVDALPESPVSLNRKYPAVPAIPHVPVTTPLTMETVPAVDPVPKVAALNVQTRDPDTAESGVAGLFPV